MRQRASNSMSSESRPSESPLAVASSPGQGQEARALNRTASNQTLRNPRLNTQGVRKTSSSSTLGPRRATRQQQQQHEHEQQQQQQHGLDEQGEMVVAFGLKPLNFSIEQARKNGK
jgi:hypothetical protein